MVAILLDAIIGDPDWLWNRLPHPVVWVGKAISWLETRLNHPDTQSAQSGRLSGILTVLILTCAGGVLAYGIQAVFLDLGVFGLLCLAVLGATLIAQKSLFEHVRAVAEPLEADDIETARFSVSMIVGRDTARLDEAGVSRAAIESLAENFSDGIVAPIFWFALCGFPGLVVYKIVNTMDSMIGHKNDRYLHFGWAAARLDDLLNLAPARLTMLLLLFSPFKRAENESNVGVQAVWKVIQSDAPRHRSPNAGWPEAAMAGRLGIALSGPRYYGADLVDEPYVNDGGRTDIGAATIMEALSLYRSSCFVQFGVLIALYFVTS